MYDEKQGVKIYDMKLIWAYVAIGVFVVALLLRFVWQREGVMTDSFDWERWRLIGVAAVFGFGLGWLFFPRLIDLPGDDDTSSD
jgi:hypothetical protein